MCLIFLALKKHPAYKLILAANRDEFYDRKTAPADFWTTHPSVVGGRDLEAGGTWLGMNKSGKIAMITNYRDPKNINPKAPSRGKLVSDFLIENREAEAYMKRVEQNGKLYNGFNLIVGEPDALFYYSNYGNGIIKLTEGLFGLSNHLLESPWPKVMRGKEKMESLLVQQVITHTELFTVLFDDVIADDSLLPETGVGIARERMLSSMFIKSAGYGTRCSTVVTVDNDGVVSFSERVFNLTDFTFDERNFEFEI